MAGGYPQSIQRSFLHGCLRFHLRSHSSIALSLSCLTIVSMSDCSSFFRFLLGSLQPLFIQYTRPYTLRTIAELTINAVIKPGQAHITINIISNAQRTIPIITLLFRETANLQFFFDNSFIAANTGTSFYRLIFFIPRQRPKLPWDYYPGTCAGSIAMFRDTFQLLLRAI